MVAARQLCSPYRPLFLLFCRRLLSEVARSIVTKLRCMLAITQICKIWPEIWDLGPPGRKKELATPKRQNVGYFVTCWLMSPLNETRYP